MATVTVDVTQEDINRGIPGNDERCAVALAMERQFGSAWCVDRYDIFELKPGGRSFLTPEEVADFIERYDDEDQRKECGPFSFPLELPE